MDCCDCICEKQVEFDVEKFKLLYTKFSEVDEEKLTLFFNLACMLCDNTKNSPVVDLCERESLLYLLVAHLQVLSERGDEVAGIMTSAAQGSVNIGISPYADANWYTSTLYGQLYWNATAKYRVGMRWTKYCRG